MSGRDKNDHSKKKHKVESNSRSARAGLKFPVSRVLRHMRQGRYASRVGAGAPVYMTAVLEYLAAEVLELAGKAAADNKKKRILPQHILLAIRGDEELDRLLKHVTISEGGVIPHINEALMPKKLRETKKIPAASGSADDDKDDKKDSDNKKDSDDKKDDKDDKKASDDEKESDDGKKAKKAKKEKKKKDKEVEKETVLPAP